MDRVRKQIGLFDKLLPFPLDGCIVVVDSGISNHIDLQNQVIEQIDFTDHMDDCLDSFGHGTHVAGICAGTGKASNGRYRGIIPGAKLLDVKVLGRRGTGRSDSLLKAMRWIFKHRIEYNVKVINISINVRVTEDLHAFTELCKSFFDENIMVIVSAGNMGPEARTISALGDNPYVITVGCHDGNFHPPGQLSCVEITSRGPGRFANRKPDLVAPGTAIMSLSNRQNGYLRKTGTSMAAPIVSGLVFTMMQNFPQMNAGQIIYRLYQTATDLGETRLLQGHGMVHADCIKKEEDIWNY